MQTVSFINEIDSLLIQPQFQVSDYEKVLEFIQFSQPYMDMVRDMVLQKAGHSQSFKFAMPMEFVYRQTYKQINDLFNKLDALYTQTPTAELQQLLHQCSRLRATVSEICTTLHQLQTHNSQPSAVNDADIQAWVSATVQHYKDKA